MSAGARGRDARGPAVGGRLVASVYLAFLVWHGHVVPSFWFVDDLLQLVSPECVSWASIQLVITIRDVLENVQGDT